MEPKKFSESRPVGYTVAGVVALAGGPKAVAEKTKITAQAVSKWERIPMGHARQVAIMSGLPLEIVRPDMVWSTGGNDAEK